jgi:HEAT repeat protein
MHASEHDERFALIKQFLEPYTTSDYIPINDINRDVHALAEAQYEPLVPLLIDGLDSPDWAWRSACLVNLGFHYPSHFIRPIFPKLRSMVLHDDGGDGHVRMTATRVLGRHTDVLEASLVAALTDDPNQYVRQSAFTALLRIAGVAPKRIFRIEVQLMKREPVAVSWDALQHILREEGLPDLR